MKLKFKLALIATLAAFSSVASAIKVDNLAHLVNTDGSLKIGDKVFSDFSFVNDNLSGFDPASIQVKASRINKVYYLSWGGNISIASTDSETPAIGDLLLKYTVTAKHRIREIDQSYTGAVSNGIGSASIAETVKNGGGAVVATSILALDDLSDPFAEPGDDLTIIPAGFVLHVTKDINLGILANPGQLGVTTISQVEQSFHQNHKVPDGGASASLLGIALLGLAMIRRKMGAL